MEKVWLESYPAGIPATINMGAHDNLMQMMEAACEQYADKPVLSNFGVEMTYADFSERSGYLAASLQHLGMNVGDRIALMMPNCMQFPLALFASFRAGLTVVNVNPMYKARELKHVLLDSGVDTVVVLDLVLPELVKALLELDIKRVIVTRLGDELGLVKGGFVNLATRFKRKKHLKLKTLTESYNWSALMKQGKSRTLYPLTVLPDDLAVIQYTSATTGLAKGAMLSHRNILSNVSQIQAWVRSVLVPGEESVLAALPLYHIFALSVSCFTAIANGWKVVLITDPRDTKSLIRRLQRVPVTLFIGLNTLFQSLLNHPLFAYANFSQLKLTIAGGMPTQRAVANLWKRTTGVSILEGYGLTEASPVVTVNPVNLTHFNGSAGLPLPNTSVKVCNEDGINLGYGSVGELYVQGPQVMQGYWKNETATREVITQDGWLLTGDMARIDEQGYVYLVDRKKDMILVSGFNVYPAEVEDVIASHPGVSEVAVLGLVQSDKGELVHAYVVRRDPDLNEDALTVFCESRLAGYKQPKVFIFCDELPKSPVGKVLRRALREAATLDS